MARPGDPGRAAGDRSIMFQWSRWQDGGVSEIWTIPPPRLGFCIIYPQATAPYFRNVVKMARINKALSHCQRSKDLRMGSEEEEGPRFNFDPNNYQTATRASWDGRTNRVGVVGTYAVTKHIDGYSGIETLTAARGLATVLRDIASHPDVKGDNERDIDYVADRIDIFMIQIEKKCRLIDKKDVDDGTTPET